MPPSTPKPKEKDPKTSKPTKRRAKRRGSAK